MECAKIRDPHRMSFRNGAMDFKILAKKKDFPKIETIKLKTDCYKMCYTYNNIYSACAVNNTVEVYSKDGRYVKSIKFEQMKSPNAVHAINKQDIVVAAENGLYIVDNDGNISVPIMEGNCIDVHVNEGTMVVLRKGQKGGDDSVHVMSASEPYKESATFSLGHKWARSILLNGINVYVSDIDKHCVTKFDQAGKKLAEYGKKGGTNPEELNGPNLCAVGRNGHILVADCYNNRLKVLTKDGEWLVLPGYKDNDPFDVFILEDTLYVLRSNYVEFQGSYSNGSKLAKYKIPDISFSTYLETM